MIEKITDQNLERYDSRLKEWCDRKFFEKDNYGKYETTEEAGAVAFYPAPITPLEGKIKFSFKETMPASGDKSPSNPSTISGVSEVKVTRCGKNLVKLPFFEGLNPVAKNGITFTPSSDGSIAVSGTATSTAFFTILGTSTTSMRIGQTYTLFGCPSGGSLATYSMRFGSVSDGYDFGSGCTRELVGNGDQSIVIRINSGTTIATPLVFKPQLELGFTATSFEPYEGADYTLPLGSTYYGGSIDLATGVMTVTHVAYDIGEATTSYASTQLLFNFDALALDTSFTPVSDSFVFHTAAFADLVNGDFRYQIISDTVIRWLFKATDYSTVEAFQEAFAGRKFVYKLATPYTVQLTPTEILSFAQTDKYTPRLNTVYTDADSVQISYLKSPIRDEYEKTQAILSLGGNS